MKSKFIDHAIIHAILWAMLVPQIILLGLNLYSWQLIGDETNLEENHWALRVLSAELLLLFGTLGALFVRMFTRLRFGWKTQLLSLIAHAGYMIFFIDNLSNIIPASIQPWILGEGNVGRWTVTLLMPGAFISLYSLTQSIFAQFMTRKGIGSIIGIAVIIPVLWYVFVTTVQPIWLGQLTTVVTILVSILMVTLFLGAIIGLVDRMLVGDESGLLYKNHYVVAAFIGLILPLLGLALNIQIPFPADFQTPVFYILAVLNGLILFCKPGLQKLSPLILFLRFLSLPFMAYFFMVFLPFLPLSLLAIVLMGAGFLMLAPLALGLFQTRVTANEFKASQSQIGTFKTTAIALFGFSIVPGYLLIQANLDRNALHTSLNYFYSHDMQSERLTDSEIERSANALQQLKKRKKGAQLPYISGSYNFIVFGDMVLTDKKIESMYQLLTGKKITDADNTITSRRRNSWRPRLVPPGTDTSLESFAVIDKDIGEKTLQLTMRNHSNDSHSIFREKISIPEGVFVTGLRLKINDEWEDGQIFDKKTAIWVFEKITEVRRDPALLYYQSPQQLDFRVYPFPRNGIREVEIDFSYHPAMPADVVIGAQKIALNKSELPANVIDSQSNIIAGDKVSEFAFTRKPYLHFILDFSASNPLSASDYAKRIIELTQQFDLNSVQISAANLSLSKTLTFEDFDSLSTELLAEKIKSLSFARTGGFWQQQALAKLFLKTQQGQTLANIQAVPIFITITEEQVNPENIDLSTWQSLIPDSDIWYRSTMQTIEMLSLIDKEQTVTKDTAENFPQLNTKQVLIVKTEDNMQVVLANNPGLVTNMTSQPEAYSPSQQDFVSVPTVTEQDKVSDAWLNQANLWLQWQNASYNPAQLEALRKQLHGQSVGNGLLLPTTSFIVVESASQWEMLKRKEKQSLNNHSGLEFEDEADASEPGAWFLILVLLGAYFIFRTKKRYLTHSLKFR